MKLVGTMMVGAGELDRYLTVVVPHLTSVCDRVLVRCEGAAEYDYLGGVPGVDLWMPAEPSFFAHEGRARNELLTMALDTDATHVLAIDADEVVTDGPALRAACERSSCPTMELAISEVWRCDDDHLWTREDGGWRTHPVAFLWRVPEQRTVEWVMRDAALACGRTPMMVDAYVRQDCTEPSGVGLLHLGWANVNERAARYQRYVDHDGGRFHSSAHLDSIMWPDAQVELRQQPWPRGVAPQLRAALAATANGV